MVVNNISKNDTNFRDKSKYPKLIGACNFGKSERDNMLNAILEATAYGILVLSNNKKVIYSNEQFIKMANLPIKITSDTNTQELYNYLKIQIKNPEEFSMAAKKSWESQEGYSYYMNLKNGKVIEVTTLPFKDRGINCGKVITFMDVTKKLKFIQLEEQVKIKQAIIEMAKEYDELKTSFFITISHELRTPLTVILGAIQLFSDEYKDEIDSAIYKPAKLYMDMITQNCYRMIKLTNNLIDIIKIDSGHMEMDLKNQDIVAIIENITLSVVDLANSKDITLVFDTVIEEKIIGCDAYLLERVMLNLLSNAVKFTEFSGEIQVNIREREDLIIVSVKDSGVGIPKDKTDIIFDRFGQVDISLNREKEGIGIGLALVRSLIEKHGGRIYLNSKITEGSEFIIELPVELVNDKDIEIYTPRETNRERINIEFSDIYELHSH